MCRSSSEDRRPINATAVVHITKDVDWYKPKDFQVWFFRNGHMFDMNDLTSCIFTSPDNQLLKKDTKI
jgi:hypothetical protein